MITNHITTIQFEKNENSILDKAHQILIRLISEMENDENNLITGYNDEETWGLVDIQRAEEILLFLQYNDKFILETGESE